MPNYHATAEGNVPFTAQEEIDLAAEQAAYAAGELARLAKTFTDAVQAHLDFTAQAAGYDNIVSACSYAGAVNPYQTEGQSFISWRGKIWEYCYAELLKVQAGTRSIPSIPQLIAELPVRA